MPLNTMLVPMSSVFTHDNMRNQKLKDLREQLKSSSRYLLLVKSSNIYSFCANAMLYWLKFGSCFALEPFDLQPQKICMLFAQLPSCIDSIFIYFLFFKGDSGLFFTNLPRDDVERHFFIQYSLRKAPWNSLHMKWNPFYISKLGLLVRLNKDTVELVADHVVCEEGKPISPGSREQHKLWAVAWDAD
ncbi:hypothetical protein GUJ93_ZPchr0011g27066 [Zizania palustris]|uniref:Uncharacterized protein n=1 Tax=Zizania palustris TaxID=103762 RepID=A0A8J5WIB1_ZIZPA|nr:hypothetical protein GUJ93_ZPchr0011g27066 [Zizania palustris]